MPAANRKPKTSELEAKIFAWLASASRWASGNEWTVKVLMREAEQLANADALASSNLRAIVSHFSGDLQAAMYWVNNSRRLGPAADADALASVIHSNLGYFSKARQFIAPHRALLEEDHNLRQVALVCGAFDVLAKLQAERVLIDPGAQPLMNLSAQALRSLQDNQVTPAHLSAVLDLAGEVMREHKTFFSTPEPIIHASRDGLLFELAIGLPADEVLQMSNEVIERMVNADLDCAALSFCFIPAE